MGYGVLVIVLRDNDWKYCIICMHNYFNFCIFVYINNVLLYQVPYTWVLVLGIILCIQLKIFQIP